MSKQIAAVSFKSFDTLLTLAQHEHRNRNEPIPSLNENSKARIESCLNAPFQTVFGRAAYVGFYKKASALFYYIAKGHPLANGNKRMACITVGFLCYINRRELFIEDKDLVDLAHYVADSPPDDKDNCMRHIERVLRKTVVNQPHRLTP
ncbi:Fic family protein [Spirosoma sp.]|uniref:type II toxin-antitoxin system death-on-curing family toxin n=1 Tax=Spirosoma sp. TaxID=1899569 RepID=UPI002604AE3C|nr:Fic family protein [Spirosoma sp.]MCX6216420.1 Fic family protein [Spirosoma sp.]